MSETSGVGFTPTIKYPDTDVGTKLADDVEKSKVKDGKSKSSDTWEAFKKQDTVINDLVNAGTFVGTYAYGLGKTLLAGDLIDTYKSIELAGKSLYNFATGQPEKVAQDTSWFIAKKLLKLSPLAYIATKGIDGAGALVKADKAAKDISKDAAERLLQVFHNERVQIDVQRYMLDKGLITKEQYEASMAGMSPLAEHYAHGNGSPIDEHALAFAAKAKETGADQVIYAQFKEGKVAAVRFGIKTSADVAAAKASSPSFAKAYGTNAVFRAGVDALVLEYAKNRAQYDKDVSDLSLPAPPPMKG